MMLFWLSLSALFGVTAVSVLAYQRGAQKRLKATGTLESPKQLAPKKEEPAVERELQTLKVGDVVLEDERDWLIVGTLIHQEEEERWFLHHVIDGGESRWFDVRKEGAWVGSLLVPAQDVPTFGRLADGITHQSMPFHVRRRGNAQVSAIGDVQDRESERVRYMLYQGPGDAFLHVFERDRGERLSLTGERIASGRLDFMPGAGLDAE